jgi:NDP-sugar pyrophosphorylase family protein
MFAVILAGGAGTRLRPLTYARRKELVPILNRPLLEYRLLNLKQHGVHDIVLACSQGMREVEEHFGDGSAMASGCLGSAARSAAP